MRGMMIVMLAATSLAGCATGPSSFPVQATRYHYNAMTDRGTIGIAPLTDATASIEYQTYAAAVQAELLRLGYTLPATGVKAKYLATVGFTRTARPLPPRRSPVTIGLGGGGGGGGFNGGGGVGGGISFPLGGGGAREGLVTELSVRIMNGPDALWEGQAQSLTDARAPDADAGSVAARLATALFSGFPGDSGRTITVK